MNDFNNGTDMLKTAAETAKRNITNIENTTYSIEPQIIELFLKKINNSKVDIKLTGNSRLWLARSVKNQNVKKSVFNKEGIEKFILEINNDLKDGKIIGYQIDIPRPLTKIIPISDAPHGHAVALVINPIKKRIIYHDSTGFDIPQELKIVFDKCFKDYAVVDYHDKSQFTEKHDNSCSYLSLLNIYYRILDELDKQPDTELDFSAFAGKDYKSDTRSENFREYLWKNFEGILLQTELNNIKEKQKEFEQKNQKTVLSFGKKITPAELDDQDYELYKDPEFEFWVENLAKSLNSQNNFTRLDIDYQK
jgi:hypothetical protein